MTAIWTPSKELWTPKHPAFRRRVSEWCKMAAGAVSTCGGKVNTKNGKVSTNANQTGGCGCTSGGLTCSNYPYFMVSFSGIAPINCVTQPGGASQLYAGTVNGKQCFGGTPLLVGNISGSNNITMSCLCGDGIYVDGGGLFQFSVQLASGIISQIYADVYAFYGTVPLDGSGNPVAGTYPASGTPPATSTILGTGGTAEISYDLPALSVASLPVQITISAATITQATGLAPWAGPPAPSCIGADPNPHAASTLSGTYPLVATTCQGNQSLAIGLSYGKLIWGYPSGFGGQFVIPVSTSESSTYYSSSTLLGTYTASDPNLIPQTITVSL